MTSLRTFLLLTCSVFLGIVCGEQAAPDDQNLPDCAQTCFEDTVGEMLERRVERLRLPHIDVEFYGNLFTCFEASNLAECVNPTDFQVLCNYTLSPFWDGLSSNSAAVDLVNRTETATFALYAQTGITNPEWTSIWHRCPGITTATKSTRHLDTDTDSRSCAAEAEDRPPTTLPTLKARISTIHVNTSSTPRPISSSQLTGNQTPDAITTPSRTAAVPTTIAETAALVTSSAVPSHSGFYAPYAMDSGTEQPVPIIGEGLLFFCLILLMWENIGLSLLQ